MKTFTEWQKEIVDRLGALERKDRYRDEVEKVETIRRNYPLKDQRSGMTFRRSVGRHQTLVVWDQRSGKDRRVVLYGRRCADYGTSKYNDFSKSGGRRKKERRQG